MLRITNWLPRAVMVVALGLSFGLAGVVAEVLAQSDMMKKDDMRKEETEKDKMMKKGEEKMMKSDDATMMKKDDTMMKDEKAMEKKP